MRKLGNTSSLQPGHTMNADPDSDTAFSKLLDPDSVGTWKNFFKIRMRLNKSGSSNSTECGSGTVSNKSSPVENTGQDGHLYCAAGSLLPLFGVLLGKTQKYPRKRNFATFCWKNVKFRENEKDHFHLDLWALRFITSSVADPWHFCADPDLDPRIHASDKWIRILLFSRH